MEQFAGRVAVITGVGSGIGRAMAIRFAHEGMLLALADIDESGLRDTVRELGVQGNEALSLTVDVMRRADVDRFAAAVVERFGKAHVLCNNAGVDGYRGGTLWEATDNDWDWTFGVNLWGVVNGLRAFVPLMLGHGEEGHIVNTASMAAVWRSISMYAITKHAVLALTDVLDSQLRSRNASIGVSVLCPGPTATRIFDGDGHRPPELRNPPDTADSVLGPADRQRRGARLAQVGVPPSVVADQVVSAIRSQTLYVLADHSRDALIYGRTSAILGLSQPDLRDPTFLEAAEPPSTPE